MPITQLPEPPSRSDPSTFASKGDALLSALPQFVTEANALEQNVNIKEASANASAALAVGASNVAVNAVNATQWLSGTSYAVGAVVWSPINLRSYRRKVAGVSTTDPSADLVNWSNLNDGGISGDIKHWPGQTPPAGWLVRDGSALSRTTYAALFAVLGTLYGAGDGSTTFNLPDDRELVIGGYKSGSTAFGTFGGTFGSKDAVIVSHNHTATSTVTDNGHTHTTLHSGASGSGAGYMGGTSAYQDSSNPTGNSTTGITVSTSIATVGSSATNANIQPTRAYLPIIKY